MKQIFPTVVRNDRRREWRSLGVKLHSKVVIYCDNDKPEENGVLVMQAHWDGNTEREDEELNAAFVRQAFTIPELPLGTPCKKRWASLAMSSDMLKLFPTGLLKL